MGYLSWTNKTGVVTPVRDGYAYSFHATAGDALWIYADPHSAVRDLEFLDPVGTPSYAFANDGEQTWTLPLTGTYEILVFANTPQPNVTYEYVFSLALDHVTYSGTVLAPGFYESPGNLNPVPLTEALPNHGVSGTLGPTGPAPAGVSVDGGWLVLPAPATGDEAISPTSPGLHFHYYDSSNHEIGACNPPPLAGNALDVCYVPAGTVSVLLQGTFLGTWKETYRY